LPHRILLLHGESGRGKSELICQAKVYAKKLHVPLAHVDFKACALSSEAVLREIARDLRGQLPGFVSGGSNRIDLLRTDLREMRRPVLIIFDSYEKAAENPDLAQWLSLQVLAEVDESPGLAVIVAGQKTPDHTHAGWRGMAERIELENIQDVDAWHDWARSKYSDRIDRTVISCLVRSSAGSPSLMATLCATFAESKPV
jgi:hypothetical protein